MSDTEIQETTPTDEPVQMIPVEDQPPEEGETLPAPAVAPEMSDNPTTPAADGPTVTDTPAEAKERAAASDLEGDLRRVLDDYVSGLLKLDEGTLPTPHTLAATIAARRGNGLKVSSGAVSDALARWVAIGFATVEGKPLRFVDYTEAARTQGLSALKAAHRASKSAERQANKPPKPVPASAAEPDVAPAAVAVATENVGASITEDTGNVVTDQAAVEPTPGIAPESTPAAESAQTETLDGYPVQAETSV